MPFGQAFFLKKVTKSLVKGICEVFDVDETSAEDIAKNASLIVGVGGAIVTADFIASASDIAEDIIEEDVSSDLAEILFVDFDDDVAVDQNIETHTLRIKSDDEEGYVLLSFDNSKVHSSQMEKAIESLKKRAISAYRIGYNEGKKANIMASIPEAEESSSIKGLFKTILSKGEEVSLFKGHIYLDTDDQEKAVYIYNSLKLFLEASGIEVIYEEEPQKGSWYRKFILRVKRFWSSEEVTKRLDDVEHALKLATIDKVQSEIDKNQVEAAAKLIEATNGVNKCVLQIGSLVFIKCLDSETSESIPMIRTLTREEMKRINDNPELLNEPFKLLQLLNGKTNENTSILEASKKNLLKEKR